MKFKLWGISLVIVGAFGASTCMAQQQVDPSPANAMPRPIPHATQLQRCQNLGRFAQNTAVAREAGESQQQYIGRLGLNMLPPNGLGLIHQRLDRNMNVRINPKLVDLIYSSKQSPVAWQQKVLDACTQTIS
ncbi:MAG: hypothetical protein ABIU96_04885 [Rhodanobacter sp.]